MSLFYSDTNTTEYTRNSATNSPASQHLPSWVLLLETVIRFQREQGRCDILDLWESVCGRQIEES